jgi:hypothetical protein
MSALDKFFATLSVLAFAGFLGILIWFVPKPGLVIVCVASVLMCGFDFVRSAYIRQWRERNGLRT